MVALLIDATLRSLALALIAWIAVATLRIRSPRIQVFIWRLVLLAAVAMPLLLIGLPRMADGASLPAPVPLQADVIDLVSGIQWPQLVAAVYFFITALLLLREAVSLLRGWRICRRATPLSSQPTSTFPGLRVRASREVTAPATFGSTVLLPQTAVTWSEAKRAAVLAHEATHVANHDFIARLVARLYRAFFWFNPLAWVLPRHLILLEEQLSDDAGAQAMTDPATYAALLLSLARESSGSASQVAMADGMLTKRIERLLGEDMERLLGDDSPPAILTRRERLLVTLLAVPTLIYVTAAGVATAAYRCREPEDQRSALVMAFDNCSAPASNPLLSMPEPLYPASARRSRDQGTVILRVLVGADGSVKDALLQKSSGHPTLDDSAVVGARRWRLVPGAVGDRLIDSWALFAVTFKLER